MGREDLISIINSKLERMDARRLRIVWAFVSGL